MSDPTPPGKRYLVKQQSQAPTVPCPCGLSTRILTIADGPAANVHVTAITDSAAHYHKECTEIYFVLEGRGELHIDGDLVPVQPGTLVVIQPYAVHRLRSNEGVKIMVIGVPALKPEDEFLVDAPESAPVLPGAGGHSR